MASLVAELTALQQREGWLSDASLEALARRLGVPLHRLESLSTFYAHFRRTPPRGTAIEVCRDLSCALAGGRDAVARLREALAGEVEIREVSCLGRCNRAPAGAIRGKPLSIDDAHAVEAAVADPDCIPAAGSGRDWGEAEIYGEDDLPYGALRRVVASETAPAEAIDALVESGLRGMGGAGFPTGRKWSLVAAEASTPKYVICNADESEPGTFKDRAILHDLSHLVIEGMAVAGRCVGAERGIVFIRHEYEPERHCLDNAIDDARRGGALGRDIFGSDFDFDVEVIVSPGGYILGEETALLECIEDRRGEPRNKPPFPGQVGLWGQPTLMNNVETFAHAVGIVLRGADWWRGLGRDGFAGHKFISVSGDVAEPGVRLVPFGATLGDLLEGCGGMREGQRLAAIAPGGASSNFLPPSALDVAIDFETLERAGSMLGSGAAIFVGHRADLLEVGRNVTRFFRNESCGKCVPCRVGSEKAVKLVEGQLRVTADTHAELRSLHETLHRTSICGLGQVALAPLLSILAGFPETTEP